ncbi:MAG TPA: carbohydrate ABC transporter permease [Solirubrobacteraceae bacterium]|nr:carbohydrate ABC transporter permease [Solirubrobacteraceae bacterium]
MSSTAAAEHRAWRSRRRARARGVAGQQRSTGGSILLWAGVILTILFCLFPFYWIINTSLKTGAELSTGTVFPAHPSLDNYSSIFRNGDFTTALRTSAIDAGAATLIALAVGSFAAYALARLRFPRKFLILAIVLSISTFPPIAIAAPLFKLWTDIGLYNTYLGLILPFLTFVLPLTIYILTSFFREIPKELEEAALVDGATHFQAFRKVVLPLAAPGLVTAGLLAFIFAWNEFLLSITLTSDPSRRPVSAAIAFFTGSSQFQIPIGTISAATVTITVPLIVLVVIFQKRIVAGLTAGALKG